MDTGFGAVLKQVDTLTYNARQILNGLILSGSSASIDTFSKDINGVSYKLSNRDLHILHRVYSVLFKQDDAFVDMFFNDMSLEVYSPEFTEVNYVINEVTSGTSQENESSVFVDIRNALYNHAVIMFSNVLDVSNISNKQYIIGEVFKSNYNEVSLKSLTPIPLNLRGPLYDVNLSAESYVEYDTFIYPIGYYSVNSLGYLGDGKDHFFGGNSWNGALRDKFELKSPLFILGNNNKTANIGSTSASSVVLGDNNLLKSQGSFIFGYGNSALSNSYSSHVSSIYSNIYGSESGVLGGGYSSVVGSSSGSINSYYNIIVGRQSTAISANNSVIGVVCDVEFSTQSSNIQTTNDCGEVIDGVISDSFFTAKGNFVNDFNVGDTVILFNISKSLFDVIYSEDEVVTTIKSATPTEVIDGVKTRQFKFESGIKAGFIYAKMAKSSLIENSVVFGNSNISIGNNQIVSGKYNIASDKYSFIIGNGTSDSSRSNLFVVGGDLYQYSSNTILNYISSDPSLNYNGYWFSYANPVAANKDVSFALGSYGGSNIFNVNVDSEFDFGYKSADQITTLKSPIIQFESDDSVYVSDKASFEVDTFNVASSGSSSIGNSSAYVFMSNYILSDSSFKPVFDTNLNKFVSGIRFNGETLGGLPIAANSHAHLLDFNPNAEWQMQIPNRPSTGTLFTWSYFTRYLPTGFYHISSANHSFLKTGAGSLAPPNVKENHVGTPNFMLNFSSVDAGGAHRSLQFVTAADHVGVNNDKIYVKRIAKLTDGVNYESEWKALAYESDVSRTRKINDKSDASNYMEVDVNSVKLYQNDIDGNRQHITYGPIDSYLNAEIASRIKGYYTLNGNLCRLVLNYKLYQVLFDSLVFAAKNAYPGNIFTDPTIATNRRNARNVFLNCGYLEFSVNLKIGGKDARIKFLNGIDGNSFGVNCGGYVFTSNDMIDAYPKFDSGFGYRNEFDTKTTSNHRKYNINFTYDENEANRADLEMALRTSVMNFSYGNDDSNPLFGNILWNKSNAGSGDAHANMVSYISKNTRCEVEWASDPGGVQRTSSFDANIILNYMETDSTLTSSDGPISDIYKAIFTGDLINKIYEFEVQI